ncbi:glycosyltransferase [Actinomycetospora chiangmaiensis]|uniref:glycosyltransferase n=1 Tax=Actinomycetospora chiangmaiensis TaxID=402650 RepID=UPI0012FCD92B|nr:glycosyltransferase [Actinomycetospora chiangmaiensis]
MKSVELVVRVDAQTKDGGDVQQAYRYRDLLEDRGYRVEVSIGTPKLESGICHLFNVDRPSELIRSVRACAGRPYVISPIHHLRRHLEQFRLKREGLLGRIERRTPTWLSDAGKDLLRARRMPVQAFDSNVRSVLEGASSVQVLARGEANWLSEDYGYDGPVSVIPNGIDLYSGPREGKDLYDIVVVGRIELRKNQLAVARALQDSEYRALFLGRPNTANAAYVTQFVDLVGKSSNMEWIPGVASEEVGKLLRKSTVSVSASYFEVLSLADLEAASAGCRVVASQHGNTVEYLGEGATYIDPTAVEQTLGESIRLSLSRPAPNVSGLPSWESVGNMLAEIYSEMLN